MSEPLLTAAMIVRDEESHLAACLESIRDVVDEMVIVDTGSTDATVTVAQSFGARVHHHPWMGDFAQARNVALDLARGRWILYIDADERLRPIGAELVRARLAQTADVALRVRLRPFAAATPYWEYRLWRSDPRIRFVGKMHEKVTMAIRDVAEADRRAIGESELFLEHVGYDGDQTHKHRRNLPLLQAQLATDPFDPYSWHHLAVVLEAVGEPEQAHAALEHALDTGRKSGAATGVLGFLELIRRRREHGQETGTVLQEAVTRYPDSLALAWLQVLDDIDSGRFEQALRTLERFDVEPEMPVEDTVAYRRELFGPRAAEARGVCLFKLGRDAEAARAYAQAQEFEPDEPAHRVKRVLAERRAERRSPRGAAPETGSTGGIRWPARGLLAGLVIDLAGVPVSLTATDGARAAAIHGLLGRLAPTDQEPIAHLRFTGHRAPRPEHAADHWVGDFQVWHDGAALSIAYGAGFAGRVEAGQATVGGYAPDLAQMFRQMGPLLLASLLGPHERFLLHGGAIQRDGRAVLVLGGSGVGKSTLVAGALENGWRGLSDDLVVVRASPAGPMVTGIPKTLVVPAEVIGQEVPDRPTPSDARRRIELPFDGWDREWRPVAAVVIPGHGDRSAATIEPLQRPELLGALVHSLLSRHPSDVRRYFSLAAALSDVFACRLLHSRLPQQRAAQAAVALTERLAG